MSSTLKKDGFQGEEGEQVKRASLGKKRKAQAGEWMQSFSREILGVLVSFLGLTNPEMRNEVGRRKARL